MSKQDMHQGLVQMKLFKSILLQNLIMQYNEFTTEEEKIQKIQKKISLCKHVSFFSRLKLSVIPNMLQEQRTTNHEDQVQCVHNKISEVV